MLSDVGVAPFTLLNNASRSFGGFYQAPREFINFDFCVTLGPSLDSVILNVWTIRRLAEGICFKL